VTTSLYRRAARSFVAAAVVAGATGAALLLGATAASASNGYEEASQPGPGLTVLETLALYVGAPLALFVVITLIVLGPSLGKGSRHRTGTSLESGPVWIDSAGVQHTPAETVRPEPSEQGGASAKW
jgi:hypothetical protein